MDRSANDPIEVVIPAGETTMKFLAFIKSSEKNRAAGPPPALMEAKGTFVQESFASGKLVDTGGLKPSSAATRLRIEQGQLTVTDGPFTEAKEIVGGWADLHEVHGAASPILAGLTISYSITIDDAMTWTARRSPSSINSSVTMDTACSNTRATRATMRCQTS
jgi:hypothetical protein